ncbi:MAG: PAS-domain containing protein [Proteobacteria bacterium]|nr:PAS-domain containing protein [Pseudomonadota bacterium]
MIDVSGQAAVVGAVLGAGLAIVIGAALRRKSAPQSPKAARLQALIDHLPVGVSLVDRDLRVVAFNRTFLELFEFPADRLKAGDPFANFVRSIAERGEYGPDGTEGHVRYWLALMASPAPYCFERTRPNGHVIEIRGAPLAGGGFATTYTEVTEHRLAEARLKENEQKFRDFAEATADWFWECDADLRFTHVSEPPSTQPASGVDELVGKRLPDVGPSGVGAVDWARHLGAIEAQRPFRDLRLSCASSDGRMRQFVIGGRPIVTASGKFRGYRGTGRDITAEIAAQDQAIRAERRLANAIGVLNEGIALFDRDDRLVLCNQAYRRLLGLPSDILAPGITFEALVRENIRRGLLQVAAAEAESWIAWRIAQHRAPVEPIEVPISGARWAQIREQRLADGGFAVVVNDITAAKQRAGELAGKTSLLQSTLENIGEGIAVFDAGRRLIAWNDRVAEITGLPPRLLRTDTPYVDLVRHQAATGEFGRVDVEAEVKWRLELVDRRPTMRLTRRRPDGRSIEIRRSPMPDGGFVILFSDVTDRQQGEDRLREAKEAAEIANRTKTEFLANMSHELRTPLNAIIGFAEIIDQEMFGPVSVPRYKEYVHDICESGLHLLRLINDILDVSKAEAGKIDLSDDIVDMHEIIDACIRLVGPRARENEIAVHWSLAGALPPLRADERRLKQILLNLLSNAVKFTPPGGSVTVEIVIEPTAGLVLRVADTGIGIAEADIPRALEPFGQVDSTLTRKYEGSGLGLPLTKALMELHGGTLQIASKVGTGTTVTVTFPPERVVTDPALVQEVRARRLV